MEIISYDCMADLDEFRGVRYVDEDVGVANVPLDVAIHYQTLNSRADITEVTVKPSKESSMTEATVGTTFDHLYQGQRRVRIEKKKKHSPY